MHANSLPSLRRKLVFAAMLFSAWSFLPQRAEGAPISASQISKGPNEFSFHLGGQGHVWGYAPGGFKLYFEYGYNLGDDFWLNLQLNPVFGDRWGDRDCWRDEEGDWNCGYRGYYDGTAVELVGGVKWKFFPFSLPFMFYAKVGGTLVFLSWPYHNGVAFAARGGGGFKYFFTDNFGIGAEANMDLGFCFVEDWGANGYSSFDFGIGLEVLF